MTKKQLHFLQNGQDQNDLSLTFSKLSLTTSTQTTQPLKNLPTQDFIQGQDQEQITFTDLQRKILKVRNMIEKQSLRSKLCLKCKKSTVPKGYKGCIKCCLSNSVRQFNKKY